MSGLEHKWTEKVKFLHKGTQEPGVTAMMEQLGFDAVPSVIVLDARGVEVQRFVGVKNADEINAILEKATKG